MSAQIKLGKTIAVGAILAASVGCASSATNTKTSASKIRIASEAPTAVKSAFSSWVAGGKLAKNEREECYGVSLKGQNDCGTAGRSSCKGAKGACPGMKNKKKMGAKDSCKGAKGACPGMKNKKKMGAKDSCKGAKGACPGMKNKKKMGAKDSCKGAKGACPGMKNKKKMGAKDSCKGAKGACPGMKNKKKMAEITCSGNATKDWQGNAFKYVPKGSCKYIITPQGRGSLKPF